MYVEKVFTETFNGRKLHDHNAIKGKMGNRLLFQLQLFKFSGDARVSVSSARIS